jgi:hypothetical protein
MILTMNNFKSWLEVPDNKLLYFELQHTLNKHALPSIDDLALNTISQFTLVKLFIVLHLCLLIVFFLGVRGRVA